MSTHNLCFGAKIGILLHTPVLLYKSGFKGVNITRACFRDAFVLMMIVLKSQRGGIAMKIFFV